MKNFLTAVLLFSLSLPLFSQEFVKPPQNPSAGGEGKENESQTNTGKVPENFIACPFKMNLNELIPSDVMDKLEQLRGRLAPSKDGECKAIGGDIGNLLSLLRPSKPESGGSLGGDSVGNAGGTFKGASGDGDGFPTTKSGGAEDCRANPGRCDSLISSLLDRIQNKPDCFSSTEGGVDTVLGGVFSLASSFGLPSAVGQIALGISTVKSIFKLLKGKNPYEKFDGIKQKRIKEELDTMTACYADKLVQDVYCKEKYLSCYTGKSEVLQSGICNSGMTFDIPEPQYSRGQVNDDHVKAVDPCDTYRNINRYGSQDQKKAALLGCMRSEKGNENMKDGDFLIDTHVMGEIYACNSYWVEAYKQKNKGGTPSQEEFRKIKEGCSTGKKTRGGAAINSWSFIYSRDHHSANSTSVNWVASDLKPVLEIARDYHNRKMKDLVFKKQSEAIEAVQHCYFGYGSTLLQDDKNVKEDGTVKYEQDRDFYKQCKVINTCSEKILGKFSTSIRLPSKPEEYYPLDPRQSIQALFIKNPKASPPTTDVENVCYGIAMNKHFDHLQLGRDLKAVGFNDKGSCDLGKLSSDDTEVGTSKQ